MTSTSERLPGAWILDDWHTLVDGTDKGMPFENGTGFLLYRDDGWMSAILSAQGRAKIQAPVFALATDAEVESAARQYLSYAGRWSLQGETVRHHVLFSLFPNWIGQDLIREVSWRGERLILTTPAQTTSSERKVFEQLVWRKADQ